MLFNSVYASKKLELNEKEIVAYNTIWVGTTHYVHTTLDRSVDIVRIVLRIHEAPLPFPPPPPPLFLSGRWIRVFGTNLKFNTHSQNISYQTLEISL